MPPTDSPPIAGSALIEDNHEVMYNPIKQNPDAVVEHLKDSLTLPDGDSSDIAIVYDGCDSLTMETPLADTSDRINHQIPIEISVDITLPVTAENLNNSDAVKDLLDKMKGPLSNLDKEWHYALTEENIIELKNICIPYVPWKKMSLMQITHG